MASTAFSTGVCGCMDDKASCIDTICCYPCQVGRQCNALEGKVNEGNMMYCLVTTLACWCGLHEIAACLLRCKVVDRYNLDESKVMSCCCGVFCLLCSVCQTYREVTLRGSWPGGICVKQPYSMSLLFFTITSICSLHSYMCLFDNVPRQCCTVIETHHATNDSSLSCLVPLAWYRASQL
jgi:Cys-rich protein (TIGR01571 family)